MTFASQLRQFSLASEVASDTTNQEIWGLIYKYLDGKLGLNLDEKGSRILIETSLNYDEKGLRIIYPITRKFRNFSLKINEGIFNGFSAYCFVEKKPVWICANQDCALSKDSEDTEVINQWSNKNTSNMINHFDRSAIDQIRTVIALPLFWESESIGVMELQSTEIIKRRQFVIDELNLIAQSTRRAKQFTSV